MEYLGANRPVWARVHVTTWMLIGVVLAHLATIMDASAQTFPPQYANALQRAGYSIFAGDVNGDGLTDVLAKAARKIVLIDFDVPIPILLKSASPTFVLLSQHGSPYVLDSAPSASILNSPAWQPTSHDMVFGDVMGTGSVALLIRARVSGQPSFLISTSASSGQPVLLQELSTAQIGFDLSTSGTVVSLSDSNRDGRADLIVRRNGLIELVLTANAQGLFVKPQSDSESILVAWRSFCASLDSGDSSSAARFLTEAGQPIYLPALQSLGPALNGLTAAWSEPRMVRVGSTFAVYGLRETINGTVRLHLIRFKRENNRWLLDDF